MVGFGFSSCVLCSQNLQTCVFTSANTHSCLARRESCWVVHNSCWFLCVITITRPKLNKVSLNVNKFSFIKKRKSGFIKSNCWMTSNTALQHISFNNILKVVSEQMRCVSWSPVIWLSAAGSMWLVETWPRLCEEVGLRHQCLKRLLSVSAVLFLVEVYTLAVASLIFSHIRHLSRLYCDNGF